jgi:hypothetical protein
MVSLSFVGVHVAGLVESPVTWNPSMSCQLAISGLVGRLDAIAVDQMNWRMKTKTARSDGDARVEKMRATSRYMILFLQKNYVKWLEMDSF